jgi:hypothetical protein
MPRLVARAGFDPPSGGLPLAATRRLAAVVGDEGIEPPTLSV